ncbi:DTW domain-containing protein 1 [Zancudomyces culisetae]|uniref:tRNA-uridine aminocarboxypropyltransferase 1 n=1 Tax=Zancudomyces culisetae TaxID=1213189 RepID=A0A1R1PE12_ZANCU|nr:DTW domain-containing protein 1 [Zancudomyces culisetae]OMH82171.1 DTW domain-containing protein 1 [Zancudomyces culisetae]|eukprot:OMH79217.1 DTW domain-containing protein 1 [Zancudomyces culisetae]
MGKQIEEYELPTFEVEPEVILDSIAGRQKCKKCSKKIRFFCYNCVLVVDELASQLPELHLPIKLHVIKHRGENNGKSTAVYAKIMAPSTVAMYTYPEKENTLNIDPETSLLLYPGEGAKTMEELADEGQLQKYRDLVVIDGTWPQANGIISNESRPEHASKHNMETKRILQNMQRVTITPRKTKFWRYQSLDSSYMATIEAIYFCYYEYSNAMQKCNMANVVDTGCRNTEKNCEEKSEDRPSGDIKDLLYFYKYYYNVIQNRYKSDKSLVFHSFQAKDYIKYD